MKTLISIILTLLVFGIAPIVSLAGEDKMLPDLLPKAELELYNRALAQQNNNLFDSSIELWNQFLKNNPRSFRGYNNLGIALYSKGQITPAIDNFETALALEPFDLKIKDNLKRALFLQVNILHKNKDYENAIMHLERMKQLTVPSRKEKFELKIEVFQGFIYDKVKKADTLEGYEAFVNKYPDSPVNSDEARRRIAEIRQSGKQEEERLAREQRQLIEERKKLEALRLAEKYRKEQPSEEKSHRSGTGSGFFISKMGHVITNAHVVRDCNRVTVGDNANKQVPAKVVGTDRRNDLALLKLSTLELTSAESKSLIQKLNIRVMPLATNGLLRSEDVKRGEKILVAGYPFGDFISNTMKFTSGIVSATLGAGDDSGQFQLDAAIQPGNSGGPIYDYGGNIVGVVVSQLNKMKMVEAIGTIPENQNFGIKASTVRQFLESSGLPSKRAERKKDKSTEEVAQIAENQALMVICFQ
jgi:S1-C subfamily serine protease